MGHRSKKQDPFLCGTVDTFFSMPKKIQNGRQFHFIIYCPDLQGFILTSKSSERHDIGLGKLFSKLLPLKSQMMSVNSHPIIIPSQIK